MPTNVTVEYTMAEQEYSRAKTTSEKISALQKMLSTAPAHKGAEKLRQEIKTKLAKLKDKVRKYQERKSKGKSLSIKKEGATIEDMAKRLHKDFIKKFKFARVWGKSAKFGGQMCGLKHILEDEDVVEVHLK